MKICKVSISGLSPYSASRAHEAERLKGETHEAYEERTWREKAHIKDDNVFIPPMAFKIGLDRAAKVRGIQIPGKGKATYTKFFESGVIVTEPVFIAAASEIMCERVHANADGVRGSGKRVWRKFPRIDNWSGDVKFHIIAPEITKEVFEETASYAGLSVGVGRFRPERGGFFGRYQVTKFVWSAI
jgi:hypothetical protein